jgi:uncharacterized protein with HEPN domain
VKNDIIYLKSILDAIDDIDYHRKSESAKITVDRAVAFDLAIVGEAAAQISHELRNKYDEIPWSQMIATRNIIIHNYLGIDYGIIWDIVDDDLPKLKEEIEKILLELK